MSSPNDSAGRIHKKAFIISTLILFIVCLLCVSARFLIRFRLQRRIGIDDAFLLFGTACLIAAVILLLLYVNKMYMVEALLFGVPDVATSPNFVEDSFYYHKVADVSLILTWCSLVAVKFCFLFLFKKLVNRIKPMLVYWWFATTFNAAVSVYGAVVYIAACPHFDSFQSFQCGIGSKVSLLFDFALSQMVVDIIGDLLILYIPCRLIWKIEVRLGQKLALASTLCLTIVVVICTVIRAAGLRNGNRVDFVWETYWQYIAASTGLSMTAATAFRSLFISHRSDQEREQEQSGSHRHWFSSVRRKLGGKKVFARRSWPSKPPSSKQSGDTTLGSSSVDHDLELGNVESGTITGLRSFIHNFGRTKATTTSQIMRSQEPREDNELDDTWPLSNKVVTGGGPISQRQDPVPAAEGGTGWHHDRMVSQPEMVHSTMAIPLL